MARERYKRLVRGSEKNPFVLVLLDLNGYILRDALLTRETKGGVEAAQLLKVAVDSAIADLDLNNQKYRVMVRGYYNLQGLSVAAVRQGLAGQHGRALVPFTAAFTGAEELFDIVVAGDGKEGSEPKIRELFQLYIDSPQCRHLFFGGCHDRGHLSLLAPWTGRSDRVTLIEGPGFHPEFLEHPEFLDLNLYPQLPVQPDPHVLRSPRPQM